MKLITTVLISVFASLLIAPKYSSAIGTNSPTSPATSATTSATTTSIPTTSSATTTTATTTTTVVTKPLTTTSIRTTSLHFGSHHGGRRSGSDSDSESRSSHGHHSGLHGHHSGLPTSTGGKVKMDIRVRAQVAGAFPGVFLSNKKLYSLTKSGLVVYNLSGKNAVLAQTVNLRSAVNPRDVVQSLNGQEMYVANYGSNAILAYNVPTSTAKNVVAPLKYIKCQLQSCRPTSLSVDPTTGDLLIVCSDDKKVAKCSSSGQVQTLPLPASASRLIHSTWLAGRKFASLVQIQSRYAICIGNADGTGSSSCQYTVQQAAPRYLIATPDNTITVVDQATNDALFVYGPGTETGLKLPLNARLLSPTSIRVDYINGQMAIISPQSVTVFDVQVKVTY